MSLSYHFTFSAPATTTADELLEFLEAVESDAKGRHRLKTKRAM
jgi:hypothetical protein